MNTETTNNQCHKGLFLILKCDIHVPIVVSYQENAVYQLIIEKKISHEKIHNRLSIIS